MGESGEVAINNESLTAKKMARYAQKINRNATPFIAMKKVTEYSHPAGRSEESCSGRQTADLP